MSDAVYEKLKAALLELLADGQQFPDEAALARLCGLPTSVVNNFLKQLKTGSAFMAMRLLTPDVLKALYENAVRHNYPAQKLWLELMKVAEAEAAPAAGPRVITIEVPAAEKPAGGSDKPAKPAPGYDKY